MLFLNITKEEILSTTQFSFAFSLDNVFLKMSATKNKWPILLDTLFTKLTFAFIILDRYLRYQSIKYCANIPLDVVLVELVLFENNCSHIINFMVALVSDDYYRAY